MARISRERILELVGELDDLTVSRIEESDATEADIVEALAWLSGDEELERKAGRPTTEEAWCVLSILRASRDFEAPEEEEV